MGVAREPWSKLVPIMDLRSWAWLPGSHRLLVVREGGLTVLDADRPLEQLPSRQVRTTLAHTGDGAFCAPAFQDSAMHEGSHMQADPWPGCARALLCAQRPP